MRGALLITASSERPYRGRVRAQPLPSPVSLVLSVLVFAFSATPAAAQWVSLDRVDETIKANVSSSFVIGSDPANTSDLVSHTDIFLQGGDKGWAGYIQVPMVGSQSRGRYEFGNLEAGVLYDVALPLLSVTLRAGVAMPTMPSQATCADGADLSSAECLISEFHNDAAWARLTDTPLLVSNSVTPRFSASVRLPMGVLFARADVGVDLLFPLEDGRDPVDDMELFFRANVGLGAKYLLFGATVEWSIYQAIRDQSVTFNDTEFNNSLAFSLRLHTPWVQPYIAGHLPLKSTVLGDVGIVTIGVTASFVVQDDYLAPVTNANP